MSKIIFEKKHFFGGLLNLFVIYLIVFAGINFLLKEYILTVFLSLTVVFFILIFLNKKWFKSIIIEDERIVIKYPFNIFGNKKITIYYSEGAISEVIYYGYMYRTPSHCKVISKGGIFRFNCTLEEVKKIFNLLKANDLKVLFNDEKEVSYR